MISVVTTTGMGRVLPLAAWLFEMISATGDLFYSTKKLKKIPNTDLRFAQQTDSTKKNNNDKTHKLWKTTRRPF